MKSLISSVLQTKVLKRCHLFGQELKEHYQIKHNRELRDVNGWLIYPIMSIERTGITKDLTKRGAYYAAGQ